MPTKRELLAELYSINNQLVDENDPEASIVSCAQSDLGDVEEHLTYLEGKRVELNKEIEAEEAKLEACEQRLSDCHAHIKHLKTRKAELEEILCKEEGHGNEDTPATP